jgi:hypothetical protein
MEESILTNKYDCPVCTPALGVWWDSDGELYADRAVDYKGFVGGNTGAFGSLARRLHVEIRKHDEEFQIFKLWGWMGEIRYRYTSNDEGDILSRKPYLQLLRKDGSGWTYYTPGIKMLKYCCGEVWRKRKDSKFIASYAKKNAWDKRWWKVVAVWFSKLLVLFV